MPQRRERIFIEGYFRGECGSEVLSVRRNCTKDNGKISSTTYGVRQGRVHTPDEIMNTLTCRGLNGGGSQVIFEPPSRQ